MFNNLKQKPMKQFKFLLLALVALVSGSVWADDYEDVTSTYLDNADFSLSTPIDNNVFGYQKDAGSAYYWAQDVTNWTVASTKIDAAAGAVFAYGSSYQLKGNSKAAPSTNPDGEASGNALGLFAVWGGNIQYTQTVKAALVDGTYKLTYTYYNQSGTNAVTNKCGVIVGSTNYFGSTTSFSTGSWMSESVIFTVTEETSNVKVSLGYTSNGNGSSANPMLFFDNVKLEKINPLVENGTYYLYNEESGLFLSTGNAWGTQAITDLYGLPVNVVWAPGTDTYTLRMADNTANNLGTNLYCDNNTTANWTLDGDAENGYTIYNATPGYLKAENNHLALAATTEASEASKWKLLTGAQHMDIINGYAASNKAAVLAAAGIDEATLATYAVKDMTSSITSAALAGSYDGWKWTQNRTGSITTNSYGCEVYQGSGNLAQTVSDLKPGIYKVTAQGFYRDGVNATCASWAGDGIYPSNMYISGNDYEARYKAWAEDRSSDTEPNGMGAYKTLADAGKYTTEFYTIVTDAGSGTGSLALKIDIPKWWEGGQWAIFSNVTLTYYSDAVSDEDIIELEATIPTTPYYSGLASQVSAAKETLESEKTIAAYNALSDLISQAIVSAADYANLKAAIEVANKYTVVTPDYTTLSTAITAAQTVYNSGSVETCTETISGLETARQAANVNDYNYVTATFTEAATLGTWTKTNFDALKNEGYSTEEITYYDKWSGSSVTCSISQTVTLPAGDYVFIGIGRGQADASTEKLTVKIGENTIESEFYCKGNRGRGVNTSGEADYSDGGTYNCENQGYGWEYRFSKFTLTEQTSVTFGATAEVKNSWASLYVPQVMTTEASIKALRLIEIANLVASANTIKDSKMNATVSEALTTAISGSEGASQSNTKDELNTMVTNLTNAIDAANASIAIYEQIAALNDKVDGFDADGKAAYADTKTAYDNGTLEDYATALAAAKTAALAQTTVNADMTLAIVNNSFEDGISTGWTQDGGIKFVTQGNTSFTNKDGSLYAEYWQPNGTLNMYQEIANMPAGVYSVSAYVKARGVTSAKLFAGSTETTITIEDAENDYTASIALDEGSTLKFGINAVGTGASSGWVALDNFRLTLVSAGLPDVTAVEGKMNADVATAQTNAISTYNSERTVVNYNAAVAAIANAQTSVNAYAAGKAGLDKVADVLANTNVYTADAYNTFYSAYSESLAKYNDCTWADNDAGEYTNTTFGSGWRTANTIDDLLLSTWGQTDYNGNLYINTWSTEADNKENSSDMTAPFFEYWTGDANSLGEKTWTATMTGLEAGAYKVSVLARVRIKDNVSDDATGISINVNGGDVTDVCAGSTCDDGTQFRYGTFEAYGVVGEDGELKFNFVIADDNNISWLSFKNVKYAKLENGSATMKVSAIASWGTFVAPFDIAVSELPENVTAYTVTYDAGKLTNTEVETTIAAGTPVLLKNEGSEDATKTFYGVPTKTSELTYGNLVGVLEETTVTVGDNAYLLQYHDPTTGWYKVGSDKKLIANRAYLKIEDGEGIKDFYDVDFETTGISEVAGSKEQVAGGIFNLAGQKVSAPVKGQLYIVNGKKYIY